MIRHMIRQSDTIIESSLPAGHPLQQKLIQAIQSYRNAMSSIRITLMNFLNYGLKYLAPKASPTTYTLLDLATCSTSLKTMAVYTYTASRGGRP
jgi:hypothetical protein